MYKIIISVIITIMFTILVTCDFCEEEIIVDDILGCTDSLAYNYDPDATIDDGSCDYCTGASNSSFILITYDGGVTWDRKCFNIPVSNIIDISVVDSNNIWVCTAPTYVGQTKAQILHSDNGGYTWSEQYVDEVGRKFFNYIEFFDELNGIAMGDGINDIPLILKTTDGGQNWIQTTNQPIGEWSGDIWRRIDFIDPEYGFFFASGINPQKMYRTINGGYIWYETNFPNYAMVLKFYDEYIGLAIDNQVIRRTIEGGSTWQEFDLPSSFGWGYDIEFHPTDPSKVWIAISDIYFSSDTGRTWVEQELSTEPIKNTDIYAGDNSIWTVGYWKDQPLFVNKNINGSNWDSIQLPLDDNKTIEGVIDGVGNNIIVIPGNYR